MFRTKRVYDPPSSSDGQRVLVDRLWPRGLSRERAHIDVWLKEIAPSDALRRRYHADPAAWEEFRVAYARELAQEPAAGAAEKLLEWGRAGPVTLLYAARDGGHNNAEALRLWLESR